MVRGCYDEHTIRRFTLTTQLELLKGSLLTHQMMVRVLEAEIAAIEKKEAKTASAKGKANKVAGSGTKAHENTIVDVSANTKQED